MKKKNDPNEFRRVSDYEPYSRAAYTHERVAVTDELKEILNGKVLRLASRCSKLLKKRPHMKDFAKRSDYNKARDEHLYKINRIAARMHLYMLLSCGADPEIPELKQLARHLNVKLDKNLWPD